MPKAKLSENKINLYDAKTHLSRLVLRALRGEEIIICRGDVPMVKLVPCQSLRGERPLGIDEGKAAISDDFNSLPDEVLNSFFGKDKK